MRLPKLRRRESINAPEASESARLQAAIGGAEASLFELMSALEDAQRVGITATGRETDGDTVAQLWNDLADWQVEPVESEASEAGS